MYFSQHVLALSRKLAKTFGGRELIRKVFTVVLEIAFTMNYIQTRVKFQKNKGSKRNDQIPHVLKCRIQK